MGGSVTNEGKVEVCIGGEWGTVCDDDFGSPDAGVVCNQLGFSRIGKYVPGNTSLNLRHVYYHHIIGAVVYADSTAFGVADSTTNIFMDNVGCGGNEQKLIDCAHISNHNCYHIEDVGIRCEMNGQNCSNTFS